MYNILPLLAYYLLGRIIRKMFEIFDNSMWTKDIQLITYDAHKIPGLRNFCHQKNTSALEPTPLHYHSDIVEIHCILKGERISYVESEEGLTPHIIRGRETFLTFPYELHNNGDYSQKPCEFYGLQINVKDRDHLLCLNKEYSNLLCEQLLSSSHRHLQISSTEIQLMRMAFNLFTSSDPADLKTSILFLSCFLFSLQYMNPTPSQQGAGQAPIDRHIQKVLTYIEAHLTNPLPIQSLAEISGYSPSYFKSKFRNETGITPAEFITLQKVRYAQKLLETTERSITDIAYELGFSSSNYFSSVFKKITNISPLSYRKAYRK